MEVTFVEATEVEQLLRHAAKETEETRFVIVDVRDEDEIRSDGKIVGPVKHIPSTYFSTVANVKDLICTEGLLNVDRVIVHCVKSQQRGPHCAKRMSEALNEMSSHHETPSSIPQIQVLKGGYEGFSQKFGETDLISR